MATGFRIQNSNQLVDVCIGRLGCNFYCVINRQFPGNKSSNFKPGQEFKNRINIFFVNNEPNIDAYMHLVESLSLFVHRFLQNSSKEYRFETELSISKRSLKISRGHE